MRKFKLLALLMAVLVLAVSCNSNSKSWEKPYDPYELEIYNGSVVVGTAQTDKSCTLYLMNDSIRSLVVPVSKKTFNQYSIGDTVHCVRHVDEVQETSEVANELPLDTTTVVVHRGLHYYLMSSTGICHYEDCEYCKELYSHL